jgi:hypothetical protein
MIPLILLCDPLRYIFVNHRRHLRLKLERWDETEVHQLLLHGRWSSHSRLEQYNRILMMVSGGRFGFLSLQRRYQTPPALAF